MSKDKNISKNAKKLIGVRTIFNILFVFLVVIIGFVSKKIYETKTLEYKNDVFEKVNESILSRYDILIKEKLNTSLLVASSLSKNVDIKKALVLNNPNVLDMEELLEEMKTKPEYENIQAEIINAQGISFLRSWVDSSGEDLVKDDPKMAHLIKYPRVVTDIVPSKYGLTISNKIPISYKDRFLGLFGVNIHFDDIADTFLKEGFNTVILLNKEDSKNIVQNLSYSKKFVGDCYVVNLNAQNYLIKILKNNLEEYCNIQWNKKYLIDDLTDNLISRYVIKDESGKEVAQAIIFKPIDEIYFNDLTFFQNAHIVSTVLLILLTGFFINYFSTLTKFKKLNIENEELININHELTKKTDEMDFNDKKLDNLFNMQPNLMFMHNGKEVTKVNKRFMGFFNRFGTFEGFKKKHRCVSELFEKYEAPNYIWQQYIDGEFWIDYLLKNPRRLYKTVMSINGDPHHFIIKFNELDYSKHVTERLIIVALVDMTQDLVNYKTLEESSKILKDIKINEKLELKEEKENTDISYEFKTQLEEDIKRLTALNVLNSSIIKSDINKIEKNNLIKVKGDIQFSDVESTWSFYIPCETSSKLLNFMKKDPSLKVSKIISKEELDTAAEFVAYFSNSLCSVINFKNFHDLKNAKYSESSVEEALKEDFKDINELFEIKIELSNSKTLIFYMDIDKDIAPFLKQIVNNKDIALPKNNAEITLTEGKKEPQGILKPKIKAKPLTHNNNKLDAYSLIQNSLSSAFSETVSKEATFNKIKPLKTISFDNLFYIENIFKVANKAQGIEWTLIFSDEALKSLLQFNNKNTDKENMIEFCKQIEESAARKVSLLTSNKASLVYKEPLFSDAEDYFSQYKLFDLNILLDGKKLPVFMALKNK